MSIMPPIKSQGTSLAANSGNDRDIALFIVLLKCIGIVFLVCLSGVAAGLTLGIMSLDKVGLEIIMRAGTRPKATAEERHFGGCARKILPLRNQGNLLLCTLLLFNVAINALLSILMADLTSGIIGFFVSTAVITLFGEIVPQAICTRYALRSGALGVPIVKLLIFLIYPLAKPLSALLDFVLEEDLGTIHTKSQLKELLDIHVTRNALESGEVHIVNGALSFKDKEVKDVMTPRNRVYALSISVPCVSREIELLARICLCLLIIISLTLGMFCVWYSGDILNFRTVSEILSSGYSRIPVYGKDQNDIIGILHTKDLVFSDPRDETPVLNSLEMFNRGVIKVWPDSKLDAVLKLFKEGRSHMGIVQEVANVSDLGNSTENCSYYDFLGVITLEDIIEEILQDEILDETDIAEADIGSKHGYFGPGRGRVLNGQSLDSVLSQEEVSALSAHLRAHHQDIFKKTGNQVISEKAVKHLLKGADVRTIQPSLPENRILCTRGERVEYATILLNGKLELLVGNETEALSCNEYTTNFSATIASDKVRIMKISKDSYSKMKSGFEQKAIIHEKRSAYFPSRSPASHILIAERSARPCTISIRRQSDFPNVPSSLAPKPDGVGSTTGHVLETDRAGYL